MLLIRAGSGVSAALRDTTFLGSEDSPVEAWKLLALQALDVTRTARDLGGAAEMLISADYESCNFVRPSIWPL